MKITADTNVLVRAITGDDERQSKAAQAVLSKAEIIALTLPALCELVWVLSSWYKISPQEIAKTMRSLIGGVNIVVNRPAVKAGLDMLDAGGDFADGVIAYEGKWLGSENFVSFDIKAVRLAKSQGMLATLLS